jgi:hypothetical protein
LEGEKYNANVRIRFETCAGLAIFNSKAFAAEAQSENKKVLRLSASLRQGILF